MRTLTEHWNEIFKRTDEDKLGWNEDDELEWVENEDGTWQVIKVENKK